MQTNASFEPSRYLLGSSLTSAIVALLQDEALELRICRVDGAIYVDGNEVGVSLIANDHGIVDVVQLLSFGFKGASKCIFPLPFGLDFNSPQEAVRRLLGTPAESRRSDDIPPWDAFLVGDYRFHFSFDESGERILVLTVAHQSVD